MDWEVSILADYADINMGQSPPSSSYNDIGKGVPFIQGNRTFGFRHPIIDTYTNEPKKEAQINDVLFSVRAPVGDLNIADKKICIGRGVASLNSIDENNSFLYYLLKYLKQNILLQENGSVFGSINKTDLGNIKFNLPPKDTRDAIGETLKIIDDKIFLLQKQNRTLDEISIIFMEKWFIESENCSSYCFEDLVDSVSVKHKFDKDEVIFLNTSDVYDGKVLHHDYSDVLGLPGQAKKSIQKDDILFTEIRPANRRFAYIDFDAEDYVVSTKLMVLRSKGVLDTSILYLFLKQQDTLDYLQMLAEGRSGTFPQITFDHLKTLEIFVPKDENKLAELQQVFQDIVEKTFKNNASISTLEGLRDTLLPKLMSGEVKVN